jgi:hypothetical protein
MVKSRACVMSFSTRVLTRAQDVEPTLTVAFDCPGGGWGDVPDSCNHPTPSTAIFGSYVLTSRGVISLRLKRAEVVHATAISN